MRSISAEFVWRCACQACTTVTASSSGKPEVRNYLGWYRHITLVLLALAFLLDLSVQHTHPTDAPQQPPDSLPLIKLSTREVRHLLARLIWPAPTSAPLICQWSQWRRGHQYWAGYYHRRRRAKTA